jgi:hypothetical protein
MHAARRRPAACCVRNIPRSRLLRRQQQPVLVRRSQQVPVTRAAPQTRREISVQGMPPADPD